MAQRGRKSADALAAIQPATETRLRAPEGLSAAESDLWLDTVQLVPASFFPPEASEQLAAYVRHAVSARDLSKLVAEFNPKWIGAPVAAHQTREPGEVGSPAASGRLGQKLLRRDGRFRR